MSLTRSDEARACRRGSATGRCSAAVGRKSAMRCGVAVHVLYSEDWDRVLAKDWSRPPDPPDYVKWDEAIDLGDRVEPLGFDSIWSTEHFGTPYGMAPNALQNLAFWAGRTKRV